LKYNRLLALAIALSFALFASSSNSADLGDGGYRDSELPVSVQNWTGFWLGAGVGYGAINNDLNIAPGPAAPAGPGLNISSIGGDGGILTLGLGYDFQIGPQWVLGALADYDFSGMKSTATLPGGGAAKLDVKSQYALGLRFGYLANPNTLLYMTGGWTRLELDQIALAGGGAAGTITSPKYDGWFLGGGVETMLGSNFVGNNNVSLKLEYRYSDYKQELLGVSGAPAGTVIPSLEPSTHTGRFSINYKFN